MYILVFDEKLHDELLSKGCKEIYKRYDIDKNPIWTMHLNGVSFNMNSPEHKYKWAVCESLKINF